MALTNVGLAPGGGLGTELVAATRRAVVPALFVQIYKATPLLNLLFGTAQKAKGGLSQVTIPVQGSSFVNFAWTDYSGSFPQPSVQPGMQNAEFNLCVGVVPISFMGMEALIQSSEAIVPLMRARMADAKTVAVQAISSALFNNNAILPNASQVINGLPQAYDDGTNVDSFGGISRAANSFWKSTLVTGAGAVLSRSSQLAYLVQCTALNGGEAPDFVVMSPSDWTTLMQDFLTYERFVNTPQSQFGKESTPNSGFRGLVLGDTPFFLDPFCPKGTEFMINTKYYAAYVSEDAPFAFSGFFSAIPNLQVANVGVVIIAMQTVCAKPISGIQITGITGGAF
ncbi:MAG: phage major capsid protein [Limisphaerales bacterium]